MLAAAGTTFVLSGGGRSAQAGPTQCSGYGGCIPNLEAKHVNELLKQHGYRCKDLGPRGWKCSLSAGMITYECFAFTDSGHITGLGGSILTDNGVPPGERAIAFLQWIAAIPFAHDPDSTTQIRTWTAEKTKARQNITATVAGYDYQISVDGSKRIDLKIDIKVTP